MSDNINPNPKRKKAKTFKGLAIFELIIIFGLVCGLTWDLFIRDRSSGNSSNKTVPASKTVTEAEPDNEDPQVRKRAVIEKEETFYQLDGKKILYNDSALGQVYLPVFQDVPACSLKMDQLITRNGYSFYRENGNITSITGIDISEYQGDIDWEKVKAAGIDFAIIRAAYRTYGDGSIKIDTKFEENMENAEAAGVHLGAYIFSQATTVDEAIEEADYLIDAVEDYDITYPLIFDWEMIYGDSARTDSVTVETLADCCIAFCERIKSAGYTPMIYQNKNTSLMKLDLPRIKDYEFWLAEYNTKPTYYYDFDIWQYTSDAYVPGIAGRVDMNISFKDYSAPQTDTAPQETAAPAAQTSTEASSAAETQTTSVTETTSLTETSSADETQTTAESETQASTDAE